MNSTLGTNMFYTNNASVINPYTGSLLYCCELKLNYWMSLGAIKYECVAHYIITWLYNVINDFIY